MSIISDYFIQKAKIELEENEIRKKESIMLFENWLKNHSFIKYQNPDLIHLLMFLRTKKYRMDKVFESFEKALIYTKSISKYSNLTDEELKELLVNCMKFFYVLKDRSENGERILIAKMSEMEALSFSLMEIVKYFNIMISALLLEEETQIAGVILIFDYTNATWNLFKKISLIEFAQYLSNVKFFAVRIKKIVLIDFPTLAIRVLEVVQKVLSEKLKQRIITVKDLVELKKIINVSELSMDNKEFFLNFDEQIVKAYHMFSKIEIDFDKLKKFETIGSFRILEID
ncbi:hypothetical protein PVAND_001567 [Polypedilum vanderplanki]|uniref:CRAL-TRIO domain-containing protein n=1 Tax=Polypedilum vanderplanki TaxID=319348 RepID=A0A9J6BPL3_POLVA|nr:hypothetical protein PVAND_001567 [Polypedilum vanderplanki]